MLNASMALKDVKPELERLKQKAVEKVYFYHFLFLYFMFFLISIISTIPVPLEHFLAQFWFLWIV